MNLQLSVLTCHCFPKVDSIENKWLHHHLTINHFNLGFVIIETFYPVSDGTCFHIQGTSFILSDYMVVGAHFFLLQMFAKMLNSTHVNCVFSQCINSCHDGVLHLLV